MPRTTVNIEAPILREIKRIQKDTAKSLSEVISELLARALAQRKGKKSWPEFRWNSRPMRARVNLADKEALYAALEEKQLPRNDS